jgi:hypothetical protein
MQGQYEEDNAMQSSSAGFQQRWKPTRGHLTWSVMRVLPAAGVSSRTQAAEHCGGGPAKRGGEGEPPIERRLHQAGHLRREVRALPRIGRAHHQEEGHQQRRQNHPARAKTGNALVSPPRMRITACSGPALPCTGLASGAASPGRGACAGAHVLENLLPVEKSRGEELTRSARRTARSGT